MIKEILQNSYLSFKLGQETFASNVSNVLNIVEMPKITKVPKYPEYMLGVMSLRGLALPVIDTRVKLGLTVTKVTTNSCILILKFNINKESVKVGILVDSVEEVIEVESCDIKPAPRIGSTNNTGFIQGMVEQKKSFTMILDMDKAFSTDEINNLDVSENTLNN